MLNAIYYLLCSLQAYHSCLKPQGSSLGLATTWAPQRHLSLGVRDLQGALCCLLAKQEQHFILLPLLETRKS